MSLLDKMMGTIWGKAYDILVQECGAKEDDRDSFIAYCKENGETREWRFCGSLGFGGKFWRNNGKLYVNCYREDENPYRQMTILRANDRLSEL